jgi:uncharacterized phage-like protein YoqJ
MTNTYRIGVTGHRRLLARDLVVFKATSSLFQALAEEKVGVGNLSLEVNTGMALGFDQLVCDVCLELGIPYVAVVPCDGQDSLWNPAQKERYSMLLGKASRVVQVNPGPYEAWKMHARNGWIVNNSDEMIVHWDGFYQGGTGGCMKLVKSKKLPFKNTANLSQSVST